MNGQVESSDRSFILASPSVWFISASVWVAAITAPALVVPTGVG